MSEMTDLKNAGIGFAPELLRTRYREKRDKRIRLDGNDQYIDVKGDFSRYVDGPYVDQGFSRDPVNDSVDAVIIGGFGALPAGARPRETGVDKIRVIEKAGDFGGTWYWNRYPGAQCDVESYCYLSLLEESGYMPKERYLYAPEIPEPSGRIERHFALYRDALLQTRLPPAGFGEAQLTPFLSRNIGRGKPHE